MPKAIVYRVAAGARQLLFPRMHHVSGPCHRRRSPASLPQDAPSELSASSALLCDLLDAPTALAACCGFDLCHKHILYLYLYLYFCGLGATNRPREHAGAFGSSKDKAVGAFFQEWISESVRVLCLPVWRLDFSPNSCFESPFSS